MLPLGHLSFAYLAYVGYVVLTRRRPPAFVALFPLAVGSQFPDLIDKPLVFYGVLPSGRSLGHSLLVATVLLTAVFWLTRRPAVRRTVSASAGANAPAADGGLAQRSWRETLLSAAPAAFAVGYLAHIVGDSLGPVLAGDFAKLSFLLYPVLSAPIYPSDDIAPWVRLLNYYAEPSTHPELSFILAAVALLVLTGVARLARERT